MRIMQTSYLRLEILFYPCSVTPINHQFPASLTPVSFPMRGITQMKYRICFRLKKLSIIKHDAEKNVHGDSKDQECPVGPHRSVHIRNRRKRW